MQSSKSSDHLRATSAEIPKKIARILSEGTVAVLVTVVETPAGMGHEGEKLLIEGPGPTAGTLGIDDGGAFETAVSARALSFLQSAEDTRVCRVKEFAPALGSLGEAKILFERLQPEPRLVVCGAGHVGAALARIAALLGYQTTLIDDRVEFLSGDQFSATDVELVAATSWRDSVRSALGNGKGVAVAIVTRGHSEDEECLRAVVDLHPDYIGLIGSKRRTNIVLARLRADGAPDEVLEAVRAPVGLDIGAVTPEEVALAIMAEIVALRRGGGGNSLSAWRRSK